MAAPADLSDQEIQEIQEFFRSPTAHHVFEVLEYNLQKDWANTIDRDGREKLWTDLQALYSLILALRDAGALKRLQTRSQHV